MPLYSDSESEFEEEDEQSDDEPTPLPEEDEDESDSEDECPQMSAQEAEIIRVLDGGFHAFIVYIIYEVFSKENFDGLLWSVIRWLLVAIVFGLIPKLIVDGSKVRCLYGLRIRSWLPERQALCLCARTFLVNAHIGTFHTKLPRDAAISTFCSVIIVLVISFVNVFFIEIIILRPIRWMNSTLADPGCRTAVLRELARLHVVFGKLQQEQELLLGRRD